MPPTPTPTTPEQASLLFYVLLVLVIICTGISMYSLWRVSKKTQSEESSNKAQATKTLQDVISDMGDTYKELVANVRETAEIQIREKYIGQINELTEQVSDLTDRIEAYEAERAGMRAAIELEVRAKVSADVGELRGRVQALELEREDYRIGLDILFAQLDKLQVAPNWRPKVNPIAPKVA